MRTTILSFVIILLGGLSIHAQTEPAEVANPTSQASNLGPHLYIGYLSYDSALVSMPQYAIAQGQIQEMRQAYNEELKRVEDEFNQKYEDFLDGQRDFPRTIMLKRQNELKDLLQKNVEFKQQGLKELRQFEEETLAPLRQKLQQVLANIAKKRGLALIVNTDSNACPFIAPEISIDIQQEVIEKLREQ